MTVNERSRTSRLSILVVVVVVASVTTVPLAAAAGSGDVSYSAASVSPAAIPAGSAVDANVTVSNTGASQGVYNVSVSVDGTVEQWANGTVTAGESKTVWVQETLWETGDHTVTVAGGSATVTETVTVQEASAKFHGGPGNLGYYPTQRGPTNTPIEAWNITDGTPQVMQPTIVGDTLYTAFHDGGSLYALNPETGAVEWSATPGGHSGSTWTTPAYANGVLYLGSNDYKLHAINASDGTELWNYSTQTNVRSAPSVVDGVVYFGSNDGNMTAVNATTGEELWHYTMYQPVLVESNPAVVDGVVYFAGNDDNVTALDATTGEKIWNYTLIDESQSDVTVANGTVFVGSDSTAGETSGDGQLYALDAATGEKIWNYTMPGDVDGSPVYADGTVYAGSRGGELVALDASWEQLSDAEREQWTVTGTDFRGAPVVAGDVLYILEFGNNSVHAYDAATGTELWWYDSPTSTLYPTPLAWNGYLYYGSGSHFYALEEPVPAITSVSATNPSNQDIAVSFDSDTQLVDISVSLTGSETATLTESEFTETDNGGSYTYTATYAGSSDGAYTVAVETAADAEGKDGGSGQSNSVTVDTTAPSLSAFSVSNPTSQEVTVSFDADEQLSTISVALSNAESATLTESDFTETDTGGSYTYTATYSGSSDGTYDATLDTASDTSGNDGASSQSDSVTVDTMAPTVSGFSVSNPSGREIQVSFDTDEQLSTISIALSNAESATLTESDVTETDAGSSYTYTATYSGSSDGTYTATLDTASDASGNDGASSQSDSVTVDLPPVISAFSVANPSNQDIEISLDSSEQLSTISVALSNAESATLTESDFTETDTGGSYTYTATYSGSSDGTYDATLATASDTGGNDGAGSESDSVTVDTTAPTVSGFSVSNPSGREIQVSFDTDEQLSTISIALSNAESATLTESDVTETDIGSSYTYTATYSGSSDGTYTATLDTASDADGNDGASSQSDSVTVDLPPVISAFSVANPSNQDVQISFDSSEKLSSITAFVGGAELATLSGTDFTETDTGNGYTYTALYSGSSNGSYTVTLDTASDADGNDGANDVSDSIAIGTAVVASSIEHVAGTQPAMTDMSLDARFSGGLLQVQAKNATADTSDTSTEADYELAGLGADNTTVLRMNITVQAFTPRALIGSAHDVTWSRTNNGDGTWNLSIEGTPAALESYFESDGSSPRSWPGTIRANESQSAAMTVAVDDLRVMSNPHRERLNGSILATDAQEFGSPQYNTSGVTDSVDLRVSGPHFASDGTNNTGYFEAFLPQRLLDDWGVSATELAGELDGESRSTTVRAVAGGVRVEFDIHYSETDVTVTVDTTAPTADPGGNQTADEGASVSFDGRNSTDNTGITSYEWDFGDGATATGATPTHNFSDDGSYTVALTVQDSAGNTDTETATVVVESTGYNGFGGGERASDDEDTDDRETNDGATDDTPRVPEVVVSDDDSDDQTANDTTVTEDTDRSGEDGTDTTGDTETNESTLGLATDHKSVSVRNATAGEMVRIAFNTPPEGGDDSATPPADETQSNASSVSNIIMDGLDMITSRDGDFSLQTTTHDIALPEEDDGGEHDSTRRQSADNGVTGGGLEPDRSDLSIDSLPAEGQNFTRETNRRPTGFIQVEHDISDDDIDSVTHHFSVRKSYLAAIGADPESVQLYRDETMGWQGLETTIVGETDSYYRFAAVSPGLSVFAISSQSPVFEIRNATTTVTNSTVMVNATVANIGSAAGTYNTTLRLDGTAYDRTNVTVAEGETDSITMRGLVTESGSVNVSLSRRALGTVDVDPVTEPDEDGQAIQSTATRPTVSPQLTSQPTASQPVASQPATTDGQSSGQTTIALGIVVALILAVFVVSRRRD